MKKKMKRHKGGRGCNRDRDGINIIFTHSYPPDYHPCSIGANDLTQDGVWAYGIDDDNKLFQPLIVN
jgi:hypothetical protein